jgi:type II secretory pathway pseudopilin PulG
MAKWTPEQLVQYVIATIVLVIISIASTVAQTWVQHRTVTDAVQSQLQATTSQGQLTREHITRIASPAAASPCDGKPDAPSAQQALGQPTATPSPPTSEASAQNEPAAADDQIKK